MPRKVLSATKRFGATDGDVIEGIDRGEVPGSSAGVAILQRHSLFVRMCETRRGYRGDRERSGRIISG